MILDTCFLIDLQREFRKEQVGVATGFLQKHADIRFSISVISAVEFLEGFEQVAAGERLLRAFARVEVDSKVAAQAAFYRRYLRLSGQQIGDFDVLIAATATTEGQPLVTNNAAHFERLPGLVVQTY